MAEFNCINCKYGMTTDDYEHCGNCDKGSNFVKMSNADRIRSMSDEELAEFLEKIVSGNRDVIGINCGDSKCEIIKCTGCIKVWLQSEAE